MRRVLIWTSLVVVSVGASWLASGCGGGGTIEGDAGLAGEGGLDDTGFIVGPDASHTLAIVPASPTLDVTAPGVTLPFYAYVDGSPTPSQAVWTIDAPSIGTIASSGLFSASGLVGGPTTVTAQVGNLQASTVLEVVLHLSDNPGNVPAGTQAQLLAGGNADPSFAWLYPYDQTVFPRGLTGPTLQLGGGAPDASYVHVAFKGLDYKGFYGPSNPGRIDFSAKVWNAITLSATGTDNVQVQVTKISGGQVSGPITETWRIAQGTLKGTVYYTEYSNSNPRFGAEMAIKPGASAPTYATPDQSCHACHEVSADGSTLFETIGNTSDGAAHDLTQNGTVIATYTGTAADATSNTFKFTWSAPYPDGTFAMASSRYTLGALVPAGDDSYMGNSLLFRRSDATAIATSGWTTSVTAAVAPAFSPDGKHLAFNFWEGTTTNGVAPGTGHNLAIMDFSCGSADGGVGCGSPPYAFSNLRQLYSDAQRYPSWPAFLPDLSGVAFHLSFDGNLCTGTGCGANSKPPSELWWVNIPPNAQTPSKPVRLDTLNGLRNGNSYLPANALHPDDTRLNYKPTVVPIAVGGYAWVVFMSRRIYGNLAAGDPFARADNTVPCLAKLWVAAIDLNAAPGTDPSHPAFYLPGQSFMHANIHGFWALDPCKQTGNDCTSGDECCTGFCRQTVGPDGGAAFTCVPPQSGCAHEFEKCTQSSDCCDATSGYSCVNGHCARPSPK